MPVSRNLSLPSSIERKFKKRPEELHDLKHCFLTPCNSENTNSNNSTETSDGIAQSKDNETNSPMLFQSAGNEQGSCKELKKQHSGLCQIDRSLVTRPTLSQPCLSDTNSVGVTSIFPHFFLGSQKDVADQEMLKECDVSNVLNVSCNCARPEHLDDAHFHRIAIRDNYQEQITPHLDEAVEFIESARTRHERVLVHCLAGVSRSATVAIAYVMYYLRLSFDDAYRFVKGKRPTISPNFNFLGQLMEYEKKLRERGHMSKPRTSSIPSDIVPDFNSPSVSLKGEHKVMSPRIEVSRRVPNPIKYETAVLIKPCIVTPSTSATSFCRRRKGPALGKLSFTKNTSPKHTQQEANDVSRLSYAATPGGAGVVLDLHVSVPPSEPHSRRLGSDGVEDDREDEDITDHQLSSSSFSHKSNSLPRCRNSLKTVRCNIIATTPTDTLRNSEERCLKFRSATAPSTPAVLHSGNEAETFHLATLSALSARERLFPHDVVMNHADESISNFDLTAPSPPRPRSQTDPATLLIGSSREHYRSPASSPLPDKFVSRKTRSPKVLRKSFNLNSKPPYGYQALRTAKQLNLLAPIPYRNRSQEAKLARHEVSEQVTMDCESPNPDGISSLTLYSPVIVRSDPMETVGRNCLQHKSDHSGACNDSIAPSSNTYKQTKSNTGPLRPGHSGTTEPFRLIASADLKPKWRGRRRSKVSNAASATNASSGSAPGSPNVLSNNNVGIISCS